jgi:4'-phosphopantetheinyl transferase
MDAFWPPALPDQDPPEAGTVRCWRVPLALLDDAVLRRLSQYLSDDEQQRAGRFLRAADRRRFVAAHAGLRLLLAAAVEVPAKDLRFTTNDTGKPALPGQPIEFNLSHSGEFVLIALASGTPVGIDVEEVRTLPDRDAIIRRFMHPQEAADMAGLPGTAADLAFFRCWVRKEAIIKALGLGMSLPLDRYRVSCEPGAAARLLMLCPPYPVAERWSLHDLPVDERHLGAVAVPVRPVELCCRTFDLAPLRLRAE